MIGGSLGTTRSMWDEQLPALAQSFRVVRYDHLGHGTSAAPPGPYTVARLTSGVLALLDHLDVERAHVGGLSLGGMVAMHLAATHPDRVNRLALICTSAHLPPAPAWFARADEVRSGGTASVADSVVARWFTRGFADTPRAANLRAQLLDTPAEATPGAARRSPPWTYDHSSERSARRPW